MSNLPALPASARRLYDLEQQFSALEPQLPESPQKQALSVLHGMIQELWRSVQPGGGQALHAGLTLDDIATMHRHAPTMEGSAQQIPLPVGTPAPDFALPGADGHIVRLSDYRGAPVVLAFYPLDWSPTCSDQLSLYQSELQEFERRGAQLLAISVDSLYSHGAWAAVRGLQFPLLADFQPKGAVAQQYHVYREQDGFSERALYVIDGDGIIRYAHVSPQLHHVPDIYELFASLDALSAPAEPALVGEGR